ncbi:hypothetical protein F511_46978 [Dorcoceras hygrometricum]|uniref:Uncharacterized protein n=1 Tax=Dorcoceras hygrometricum TaxID=472368 RepID=A0A2Z6ZYL4_9LAMI|nr:hypothetical protein F511_46978 [Dorcoceras hygrometricum]
MMNRLVQEQRNLLEKKKKIQVISTADESVSSRKDISTVDESINSRYSRRRRSVDGAGTKKFSRKLQLDIQQMREALDWNKL